MPWLPELAISYSQDLASNHNDARRKIIQSDWYQQLSGGCILSRSMNRITQFENADQGIMMGKGLDSNVTGTGGVDLIWDDPNNPTKVESDVIREKTAKDFRDYSLTRLNNPTLAAQVIVQQRTHQTDVSGIAMMEAPDQWYTVIIAMEAEKDETIKLPLSGKVIERKVGDLMDPDRFPNHIIEVLKRDPRIWAGRYQQRPNVLGGGSFKIQNWRLYNPYRMPELTRKITSLDCSFKDLKTSDFNALIVLGESAKAREIALPITTLDPRTGMEVPKTEWTRDYYICDLWHKRADIVATEQALLTYAKTYPECAHHVIEDKANGPAIVSRLKSFLPTLEPFNPGRSSKEERGAAIQPRQERGDLYLPLSPGFIAEFDALGVESMTIGEWWDLHPPKHKANAEFAPVPDWCKVLIDEFAIFPVGQHDDIVDAVVQGVLWCLENRPVDTPHGQSRPATPKQRINQNLAIAERRLQHQRRRQQQRDRRV